MPTNFPAIIFRSLPLVSGGLDPTKWSNSYLSFVSELYCGEHWLNLLSVDHNEIKCVIEHYTSVGEVAPMENSLAYCSSTFQVTIEDGQLLVKIKVVRLRW